MDSKFTVSITDVTGSKHYEVRRITKRALIIAFAILLILIPSLVSAIHRLNQNVHRLEFKNNRIINAIAGRHPFQSEESQDLGEDITANIRDIFGKVESIEEAMSINTSFEMNLSERMGQAVQFIEHREDKYKRIEERISYIEQMMGLGLPGNSNPMLRVDVIGQTALYKKTMLNSIPNGYPVRFDRITSRYGPRTHPIQGENGYHKGVDMSADPYTTIRAVADGVVEFAGFHRKSGLGNLVIIHHNYAFRTLYGHLSKSTVRMGDFITKGDPVGSTGNSGLSSGPHLHYEIWHNGKSLNPEPFMKWRMDNFGMIFREERGVKWQSLEEMIRQRLTMQTQLSLQPALG